MKEFHKKLNKVVESVKAVSLDANEKKKISDFLKSHMEENPILNMPEASKAHVGVFSKYLGKDIFQNIFAGRLNFATVAFAAFLVIGGSAYASQSSLPGDVLYPAKILGERIKSSITFNTENKAALNAKYALERLEEVEELKKADKLDPETKAELQISFLESSRYSIDSLESVKNNKKNNSPEADKISADFETKLGEHKEAFMKLSVDMPESSTAIKFASSVDSVLNRLKGNKNASVVEKTKESFTSIPAKIKNSNVVKEGEKENNKDNATSTGDDSGTSVGTSSTGTLGIKATSGATTTENTQNLNSNTTSNSTNSGSNTGSSGSQGSEGGSTLPVKVNIPSSPTGGIVPGL